jgi:vacuolar-type H+-ATPase subunit I/STV1
MKVITAIYNFIVGDMVILLGVALTVAALALINNIGTLAALRGLSGLILVAGVLVSLATTLSREAFSPKR